MTAIAIDDEPIALEIIKSHASKVPFLELKETFTNAFEAAEYLQKEKTDLLFLDIKMPDISGMEFLKTLSHPPMAIFTTAYSEHAVQSFELDAVDYLLKPFSLSRFLKACNKAQELYFLRNNHQSAFIFIKSGYEQIRVDLSEILYVESAGNYMNFILTESKILSRMSMEETLDILPKEKFIRIHRSFIVAVDKIEKADRHQVWINDMVIPIGKSYEENLHLLENKHSPNPNTE
ncbi:MAG TPA: LytTR family DNA-binding domain-containing protein [Chitinophagaceae bacterium]|nr:LytTR family DNA-binding domain-containing protein [Chitinophagaceae bacterium]